MRFLLLLLLGLALVGMHGGVSFSQGLPDSGTYPAGITDTAVSTPSDVEATDPPAGSEQSTLHLCVAVPAAAAALLVLIRWLRVTVAASGGSRRWLCSLRSSRPLRASSARGPSSRGRGVLTEVCVLRV